MSMPWRSGMPQKHESPDSQLGPKTSAGRCPSNSYNHNSADTVVKQFCVVEQPGGERGSRTVVADNATRLLEAPRRVPTGTTLQTLSLGNDCSHDASRSRKYFSFPQSGRFCFGNAWIQCAAVIVSAHRARPNPEDRPYPTTLSFFLQARPGSRFHPFPCRGTTRASVPIDEASLRESVRRTLLRLPQTTSDAVPYIPNPS